METGSRFQLAENANDELMYLASFGNLPNKTVYMSVPTFNTPTNSNIAEAKSTLPWGGNGNPRSEEIKASLTTTSPLFATGTNYSATSGSIPVLLPTYVDSVLYDLTKRDTPLASGLVPRVTNRGIYADYIKKTALPSAVFKPELAAQVSAVSTYTRAAKKMSYMYACAEISGPMMVASSVWQGALALETESQYRALKELEENCIINGNPTASDVSGGVTDENAFAGFITLVTTNTKDKTGATLLLSDIRDGIRVCREAKGHPNFIVTDYKTLDDIKGLIHDELRYPAPTYDIAFGIVSIEFEKLPIVPDLFMPTTAAVRELHIWDTTNGNVQLRVLQDAMFEELAKTADSYKFMIKEYLTMIIVQEAWCYRIYDLA